MLQLGATWQLVVAGLTVGSGYALVALGIHIILRATRVINFAQGEFVVLGGLISYSFVTAFGANPFVALAATTVIGFALGIAYERFILRPAARVSDVAVTIATIGTASILLYGHAIVWGSLPLPLPPFSGAPGAAAHLGGVAIPVQSFWVLGLLLAALAALYVTFERTTYGTAIRAAASDPIGAQLIGIDVQRARMVSVGVAIALAAFGGAIIAPITLAGGAGGVAVAIKGFVGAVIGGLDSAVGCALGGLLVGVLEILLQGAFSYGVADPVVYSLLLAMLLVRPQGLLGHRSALRD